MLSAIRNIADKDGGESEWASKDAHEKRGLLRPRLMGLNLIEVVEIS